MAKLPRQHLDIARGQALDVDFALPTGSDVSAWAMAFTVRAPDGTESLALTTAGGAVAADSATAVTASLTAAQTLGLAAGTDYEWSLWRTDAGTERPMAWGDLRAETTAYTG